MDERRWGFAGLSDAEYEQFVRGGGGASAPAARAPRPVVGARIVEVRVDDAGDVEGVTLAADWAARLDPHRLGAEVLAAMNAAAADVLARGVDATEPAPPRDDAPPWTGSLAELTAAARDDVTRYTAALQAARQRVVEATSPPGHVTARAQGGWIVAVDVDVAWARTARRPAVEAELTDALRAARAQAWPAVLRHGPCAPATRALQALSADPERLLRVAGVTR